MGTIAEMFRYGGVFSYIVLATGMSAMGLAFLAAITNFLPLPQKKRLALLSTGILTLLAVFISFGTGAIGYFYGMNQAMTAAELATPEMKQRLIEHGMEAAKAPFLIAIVLNVIPLIIGLVTVVRGFRTPKPTPQHG